MGVKMVSLFLLSLLLFPMREGGKGGAILPLLLLLMGRGGGEGRNPFFSSSPHGGERGEGRNPFLSSLPHEGRKGRRGGSPPLPEGRRPPSPPPPPLGPTGPGPAQRNFFFGVLHYGDHVTMNMGLEGHFSVISSWTWTIWKWRIGSWGGGLVWW